MSNDPISVVDVLQWRAKNQPDRLAYRFLTDGEREEALITYSELDSRARSIAAALQAATIPGDRVLLLFQSGLDFIAAFYGCLYARVLAIPAYPPHPVRPEKSLGTLERIIADAAPRAALLSTPLLESCAVSDALRKVLQGIALIATDHPGFQKAATEWRQPEICGNDIAFLQYTSGSTSSPRGVMVSHQNLMHNLGLVASCFGHSSESHAVIWLPPYHDMGLIGGILQPMYSGYPSTLLPHMLFLQRPLRWLQAVSRYKATTSGGPNFAFELCLKKIKPEQRELLDLRTWDVAFNGAEPVYHKTLDQFAEYFAPCGFSLEAFTPCYGLAESTLIVSGVQKGKAPAVRHLDTSAFEQNDVSISLVQAENTRALVSCGPVLDGLTARIVHPETLQQCPESRIGEIWLSGPSVTAGYWNKAADNATTYGAFLSGKEEGPFLRTGDLGFLYEGELYITGRLKDVIICDGKNHYAQDIEHTVEGAHPAIRPTGSAVFSISRADSETIIVIAEIEPGLAGVSADIVKYIQQAVALGHELRLHDIVLTGPGGIPRTTSGKKRRFLCKSNYLSGSLHKITLT